MNSLRTSTVATVRRLIQKATTWARNTGIRTRISVAAAVLLIVTLGFASWSALGAAREAEVEARSLLNEVSALSVGQLLEPDVYRGLSEQAARTDQAVSRLQSRLRLFRPLEWVPVLGTRLESGRNTAELAQVMAEATQLLTNTLATALTARRNGDEGAFSRAFSEHEQALDAVRLSLAGAEELSQRPVLLDEDDRLLLRAGFRFLRTASLIAATSPQTLEGGVEVLQSIFNLQQMLDTPWAALLDSERIGREVSSTQLQVRNISADIERIAQSSERSDETLELAEGVLTFVEAVAETASALLGITDAMRSGFLTPEFGVTVGDLLTQAQERSEAANRTWEELREDLSKEIAGELATSEGPTKLFEPVDKGLRQVNDGIRALRGLLGYDAPKTYLLVMQNQDEIRATGGFIGITVEVPIRDGTLGEITIVDSTTVDRPPLVNNPQAPEPLFWYLWMGRLLFRDANWNPHYPASADTLIKFYESSRNTRLDGAVTATKLLGLDMVDVLPGLTVPEFDEALTREQAVLYMEDVLPYPCTERHVSKRGKRCFDEDLLTSVMARLRGVLSETERNGLLEVVREHLDRKNVLVYVDDESTMEIIHMQRWDGAIPPAPQDFLMVVDSSLPGHTTAGIVRSMDYTVDLNPGGVSTAQLRVRYHNERSVTQTTCRQAAEGGGGCYWNYMRVFIPQSARNIYAPPNPLHEGSEKLIWAHRDPDSSRVLPHASAGLQDLTEIGGFITVEGQTTLTVPISYVLGPQVTRQVGPDTYEYRLQHTKQPGMDRDQVIVRVGLPTGSQLVAANNATLDPESGAVVYRNVLDRDTELVVVFKTGQS